LEEVSAGRSQFGVGLAGVHVEQADGVGDGADDGGFGHLGGADLDEGNTNDRAKDDVEGGGIDEVVSIVEAHGEQFAAIAEGLVEEAGGNVEIVEGKAAAADLAGDTGGQGTIDGEKQEAALAVGDVDGGVDDGAEDVVDGQGPGEGAGDLEHAAEFAEAAVRGLGAEARIGLGVIDELVGLFDAEGDSVAISEGVGLLFEAVDLDAVAGAGVFDDEAVAVAAYEGVGARGAVVPKHEVVFGTAADEERDGLDGYAENLRAGGPNFELGAHG
jgi:hypothetical protein